MSKRQTRYSPEVRERAVWMVFERRGEHGSQWAAIQSIAAKIGCEAETLRLWVRRHERDRGLRPGVATAEQDRARQLEREVRKLRQANEILRKASAYMEELLGAQLDYGRQQNLLRLAPTHVEVPSGSRLRLNYPR